MAHFVYQALLKHIYILFFIRDQSSDNGGELFLGGSNPAYYMGNFTYLNLTDQGYWQFIIDSISVQGLTVCPDGCDAIADTGVYLIVGPQDDIDQINAQLGFEEDGYIDCSQIDSMPSIVLYAASHFCIIIAVYTLLKFNCLK